jgi:hypothetical protein
MILTSADTLIKSVSKILLSTKSHTMVNHVELNKKAFVPFSFLFDIGLIVPSRDGTNIKFLTRYIYSANNLVDIFYD